MPQPDKPGLVRPPSPTAAYERHLDLIAPISWLRSGWHDLRHSATSSLVYGLVVFALSYVVIWALGRFGFSYVLLPAIAGFMIVGPLLALGLYEKSRLLQAGVGRVSVRDMMCVKAKSSRHLVFVGVILLLLMLFWMRTAILLYALFFGLDPVGGLLETLEILVFTTKGRALLSVGTVVGAGLAALAFSVSAFSIPLLMNERKDAITAMVVSLVIAWANKGVVLLWGGCVLLLFLMCVATGFLGLILIFPLLGHATWHAYLAVRQDDMREEGQTATLL